jgi:histidine triad (HIT) family protein
MTIFSKIIAGEIPSYKIAETDRFFAFLDISPLVEGHVLVVPKVEVDKIFDLEDSYLTEGILFAKKIGKAIEKAFDCKRCGISVIGLEVPHAHIHLMPISKPRDMNFANPTLELSEEQFKAVQQRIIDAL